ESATSVYAYDQVNPRSTYAAMAPWMRRRVTCPRRKTSLRMTTQRGMRVARTAIARNSSSSFSDRNHVAQRTQSAATATAETTSSAYRAFVAAVVPDASTADRTTSVSSLPPVPVNASGGSTNINTSSSARKTDKPRSSTQNRASPAGSVAVTAPLAVGPREV